MHVATISSIVGPANDRVYTNRDGLSTLAAVAKVTVMPGVVIDANIYGRLREGKLSFEASFGTKGFSLSTPTRKALKAQAEQAVLAWPGWPASKADAKARLLAPPEQSALSGDDKTAPTESGMSGETEEIGKPDDQAEEIGKPDDQAEEIGKPDDQAEGQ